MYHGIIIDQQFEDLDYPKSFKTFNFKQDGNWGIYGIEVEESNLDSAIDDIQKNMKSDQPWYAHLYNDQELIVIFKEKIFKVTSDKASWGSVLEYGRKLNIPQEQLAFSPTLFSEEQEYFNNL